VHVALCEDVNTPLVLKALEALILTCNKCGHAPSFARVT
jgi:translation initiation factor 2 beta subunit (eIF-2beta)/eIF-5